MLVALHTAEAQWDACANRRARAHGRTNAHTPVHARAAEVRVARGELYRPAVHATEREGRASEGEMDSVRLVAQHAALGRLVGRLDLDLCVRREVKPFRACWVGNVDAEEREP